MNPSDLHNLIRTWERKLAMAEDSGMHDEAEQIRALLVTLNYFFSAL
jgi:hypothetical protein